MEVETPVALAATVTDVQIESLRLTGEPPRFLQTSPEYPMKRLLAAGSGDIYQLCHVFRAGETSRLHNPEFTMLEWYRLGMDLPAIMEETAALAAALLAAGDRRAPPLETLSYAAAFQRELGCDPLSATLESLAQLALTHGLAPSSIAGATRDELLDFLIATQVGPTLGRGKLTCLHHFPASQAALATARTRRSAHRAAFRAVCGRRGTRQWLCRAREYRRTTPTLRHGSRRKTAARTHCTGDG